MPFGGYISFPVLKPACGGAIRELFTICCFKLLGDEIGGDGKAFDDGDDVFPLVLWRATRCWCCCCCCWCCWSCNLGVLTLPVGDAALLLKGCMKGTVMRFRRSVSSKIRARCCSWLSINTRHMRKKVSTCWDKYIWSLTYRPWHRLHTQIHLFQNHGQICKSCLGVCWFCHPQVRALALSLVGSPHGR